MASMDFVYDLLDKIHEEKIEYLLVALQKGKTQYKVDVFYQLDNDEAAAAMLAVMENVQNAINDGEDQDGSSLGNEEEPPEEF